jgi:hypothetical protein
VDRDGVWFHEDEEIVHAGILASLRDSLRADAGGHFVQVGQARIPVEVEDAPFVVLRLEPDEDGMTLLLNDGSRERLDPATLRIGADEVPRCRVKADRFRARLSRAAAYQLLQRMEDDPAAGAVLRLGRARHPVRRDAP